MRKKLDEALCRNVGKACNAAATDTRARTLIFVPAHVFVRHHLDVVSPEEDLLSWKEYRSLDRPVTRLYCLDTHARLTSKRFVERIKWNSTAKQPRMVAIERLVVEN